MSLPPIVIHQSDLASWNRCPEQFRFDRVGARQRTNSATAFGSVTHHALQVLERTRDLDKAIQTFLYYWHPLNIEAICEPVPSDGWLPRQSYGELRKRGVDSLRKYADIFLRYDDHELLALEYEFLVPLHGTGMWLAGTIDRLAVRWYRQRETLAIDDFKGLALNTPLPTPVGWTTMGQVQVGDEVFGSDGRPCRVTNKSAIHERPCYRVTFDDGSSVVADNVHLWEVWTGREAARREVFSTEQLRERLVSEATGQRDLRVLNARPLDLPEADLPIDPYVLGVWLGDGAARNGVVSVPDGAVWSEIEHRGYALGAPQAYREGDCRTHTLLGLTAQLRDQGVLGAKHIPDLYLRAGYGQRLDLLRGLMDSDGSWNRPRKHAVFCTTDPKLAAGVGELVASLGWKPRTFEVQRTGFGLTVTAYDVCFTPTDANPFLLPRKADLVAEATVRSSRRIVKSVEPTLTVPTQCITVDSPDSTYLCGEQMVPTHNTGKQKWNLRYNVQGSAYAYASLQPEFWSGASGTFRRLGGGERTYTTMGFSEQDALDPQWGGRGQELGARFRTAPRKFTWINMQSFKPVDGGYRGPVDFERLKKAAVEVSRSVEAGVYPLRIDGEVCRFCPYRDVCGGVGLPDDEHGDPAYAVELVKE